MRGNKLSSASGMFLIELLLAILIFSVASAICLRVFVTANQISTESHNLNRAVIAAQNGAECFKATGGNLAEAAGLLNGELADGGSAVEIYFDSAWQPAVQGDFKYILKIGEVNRQGGSLISGEVTVSEAAGGLIFSIPVSVTEVAP